MFSRFQTLKWKRFAEGWLFAEGVFLPKWETAMGAGRGSERGKRLPLPFFTGVGNGDVP